MRALSFLGFTGCGREPIRLSAFLGSIAGLRRGDDGMSARIGMSPIELRDFLDAFRATAVWVEPSADRLAQAQASGLRDPNDVPILAMLIAAGADCLVSGDKDLLAVADRCPILTPGDFCTRHAP